jgi:hypothetical protein
VNPTIIVGRLNVSDRLPASLILAPNSSTGLGSAARRLDAKQPGDDAHTKPGNDASHGLGNAGQN